MDPRTARAIAELIFSIGKSEFGLTMDAYMSDIISFDMSCIFLFSTQYAPALIHDGYSESLSRKALQAYLKGGYLLDPFYVACVNEHPRGVWRMDDLAPDSFFSSGFLISKEIHPCVSTGEGSLVEEVGFIIPLSSGTSAVYSLMRNLGSYAFSEREMKKLEFIEPIVFSSISSHCRNSFAATNEMSKSKEEDMEGAFIHAFEERLTCTQRTIVKLILRGHSNISIANHMDISEGTVKVHKYNIYKRLDITTQSELFQMFISYLTKDISFE